ncbi:MAG: hypothetical protein COA78_01165 [Blastopirellula sp.]|nr:MAG: hypothetical protein COA78_01165 [Blastopirellula sp.]
MLEKLQSIFNHVENMNCRIALRDLFSLGCYLYNTGKKSEGSKMCWTALEAANCPDDTKSEILNHLENGDAKKMFGAALPHHEIISLHGDMT